MAKEEEKTTEEEKDIEKAETEEGAESTEAPVKGKKKLIIIIAAVLLIIAIAAGLYFSGIIGGKKDQAKHDEHKEQPKAPVKEIQVFMDMAEFIVNLDRGDKQPSFLKMTVTLQLPSAEIATKVQAKIPLIRDAFQVYLRELRADELQGSAGIYRLREELLLRINKVMYPEVVIDILFKEILVQ